MDTIMALPFIERQDGSFLLVLERGQLPILQKLLIDGASMQGKLVTFAFGKEETPKEEGRELAKANE